MLRSSMCFVFDVSCFAIYPPIHRYYLRSIHDLFELCTTLRLHHSRFSKLKIAPLSHVFKGWLSFARTSSAPYSAGSEWCSCTIVHSPFTCLKPMVNRTVARLSDRWNEDGHSE